MLPRLPKITQTALRDLRYGRPLAGTIKTRYAHLGARHTTNSDYDELTILFGLAGVTADDVIVDVGCGKGRVLNWLLSNHRANRMIGIEIDPAICATTARRLRRFRQITILCGDAVELLPADGTLFYLANPFDAAAIERFRDALITLRADSRRPTRILYSVAKELHVFEKDARFQIERVNDPQLRHPAAVINLRLACRSPQGNRPRDRENQQQRRHGEIDPQDDERDRSPP
jgi:SAM-dependent methyltransferase